MKILRFFGLLAALITFSSILNNDIRLVEQDDGKIVAATIVSDLGPQENQRGIRLSRRIPTEGQEFYEAPLDPQFGNNGWVDTFLNNFVPYSIESLTVTDQDIELIVKDIIGNRAEIHYYPDGLRNPSFGYEGVQIWYKISAPAAAHKFIWKIRPY